jgi:large subunit ribosomal protein L7/L12
MSTSAVLDDVQKLNDDEKVDFVVGMVAHMSVGGMTKLVKTIEKKFDVVASGGGGTQIIPPTQQKPVETIVEKTEFTVLLKAVSDSTKKIGLIKEVRAITGLGLKEAKDLVDGAPKPVKSGMPKADAEAAKAKLEAAGATVELL